MLLKKLWLSFLIMFLFIATRAQRAGEVSYYYKGAKIYLPVSYDRVLVEIKAGRSVNLAKKAIARVMAIAEDSIEGTPVLNQVILKLGNNAQKPKGETTLSKLEAVPELLFSRPLFKSASGKYNSYGKEFIVKLKTGTPFSEVQKLMDVTGCKLARKYPFQKDIFIISAGIKAGYDGLAMANHYFETNLFEYAEPEMYVMDALDLVPNDPLYNRQWAHKNTGSNAQFNGTPGVDMKIQEAWAFTMGSSSIKIGLIDDGVDLTHPDLQANILQGFNGATLSSNPGDGGPLTGLNAHGTNCAGIIAAIASNSIGVAGVAPNCKIIPAVIFNGSNYLGNAAAAACFDYVRLQGADIISNSWGGGSPSNLIDDAINRAVTLGRDGKGCIVFASTGNDNAVVHYPATNPEVVSVGGISMCNQRKSPTSCDGETSWGANYGTGLDVVAPAVKIATTDIQGTGGYNTKAGTGGNYYTRFNGTSSSCPNAAGVMALILSFRPELTGAEAKRCLYLSCNKMPAYTYGADPANPDQQYGSWNNETGYGSVNAQAALQLLAGCTTTELATPGLIAGPEGVCRNSTGQVFTVSAVDSATAYLWTLPAGASGSSSANSISLDFNGTYVTGNICVSAINSCVQSAPSCRQVKYYSQKPAKPEAIAGKTVGLCVLETYSIPAVANTTNYTWVVPANTTIVSGQGTTSIQLAVDPLFVSGNISVTASNCMGNSAVRMVSLARTLPIPAVITGPVTEVCAGSTQLYTCATVSGATGYLWTVPPDAVINSGQGTNTISVTFPSNFVSGKITAAAENACGTGTAKSISIGSKPGTPGVISGPSTVCPLAEDLAYSINPVAGLTYNWLVPNGATITSGQGTAAITVTWGSQAGSVKVSAVNACGASGYRVFMVNLLSCTPPAFTIVKQEAAVGETIKP